MNTFYVIITAAGAVYVSSHRTSAVAIAGGTVFNCASLVKKQQIATVSSATAVVPVGVSGIDTQIT